MTRTGRISEVASLLKQARQHETLARKYATGEEGRERNMDRASDMRRQAQDLLDGGKGNEEPDEDWVWVLH